MQQAPTSVMTRRYARSCRGRRAYNHAQERAWAKSHNNWSMALRGLVGEIIFPGATDALAFITYVTQILVPNLWVGACVVMNNLSAHKVTGIREAIELVGATVLYLSPNFARFFANPRTVGQRLKSFSARSSARTYAQAASFWMNNSCGIFWDDSVIPKMPSKKCLLDQAITDVLAAVTTQDIIGWFTHCCCYVSPN